MKHITVEISKMSKIIKGTTILNNITLNLESGNIYGIIGTNGSGKSMLFKAICGLINATSGTIKVFNNKIANGKFPKETGILIEIPGFLPQYSAFKNLKLLASINNVISDNEIIDAIKSVGLDPLSKKPVKKFSLGMKQRLGIAQALMEKPKLIILDEPMNALDTEGISLIRSLLLELKHKDITILLSSHNHEDIDILCDHVYKMENGSLLDIS